MTLFFFFYRKRLPTDPKFKRKGKQAKTYEPIYQWQANGMMLTSWMDKRPVHVLSTQSKRGTCITKDGKSIPIAIQDYNNHMNGVDRMDQV